MKNQISFVDVDRSHTFVLERLIVAGWDELEVLPASPVTFVLFSDVFDRDGIILSSLLLSTSSTVTQAFFAGGPP
jgi:hypothetical protein